MSEPLSAGAAGPSRPPTRILRLLLYGLIGFVLLGFFPGDVALLLDFIFTLCLGWWKYLTQVGPRIHFDVEIALCFVVALVLATVGLHRIFRGWRTARGHVEKWRAGWTLRITAMLLLFFATSIAATGIVHQVGWLFKAEGVIDNASLGRTSDAMNNVHQLMVAIRMYTGDHEELLPRTLEELAPKYCTRRVFFVRLERNEPPERLIYFPGYKETDPEDTIIVASPRPIKGRRVIGQNDCATKLIDESEFRARLERQFGRTLPRAALRALQSQ